MNQNELFNKLLHLFAGGLGATAGQFLTCPLDVVQTRLLSTKLNFSNPTNLTAIVGNSSVSLIARPIFGFGYFQILFSYMKHMVHTEGVRSLFKGLSPSLLGIVPAKSIYFFCYANAKSYLYQSKSYTNQHTVNTISAVLAGSVTGTFTNPIWYIKTMLQLDKTKNPSIYQVVYRGYQNHGIKCFFRGLSASYVGVLETVIYFLVYEDLKQLVSADNRDQFGALNVMIAAVLSKSAATTIMYPHEVVRVRLREDVYDLNGRLKYRNFIQTLFRVAKEEGRSGLYGGFGTSLLRQLPNTAVTFLTYEAIVYIFGK